MLKFRKFTYRIPQNFSLDASFSLYVNNTFRKLLTKLRHIRKKWQLHEF